jgi:hypothetical protein
MFRWKSQRYKEPGIRDSRSMKVPEIPLSSAEAVLSAVRSVLRNAFLYCAAVSFGIVVGAGLSFPLQGFHLEDINPYNLLWIGSPGGWFWYQFRACASIWGFVVLPIHAVLFALWMHTEFNRYLLLPAIVFLNCAQVVLVPVLERAGRGWQIAVSLFLGLAIVAMLVGLSLKRRRRKLLYKWPDRVVVPGKRKSAGEP